MCGFKNRGGKEGIVFSDGTFIALEDLIIENLTPDQRKELEELHLYNDIAIRKRLHELGNISQNILNRLETISVDLDAIKDGYGSRVTECPVNRSAIVTIVEDTVENSVSIENFLQNKWVEVFKAKLITAGNLAKAITAILFLIGVVFGLKELL